MPIFLPPITDMQVIQMTLRLLGGTSVGVSECQFSITRKIKAGTQWKLVNLYSYTQLLFSNPHNFSLKDFRNECLLFIFVLCFSISLILNVVWVNVHFSLPIEIASLGPFTPQKAKSSLQKRSANHLPSEKMIIYICSMPTDFAS